MALTVHDPEASRLARELARRRGTTVGNAVVDALRAALGTTGRKAEVPPVPSGERLVDRLLEISRRYQQLPTLDHRTPDEILGYDQSGLPR